MPSIREEMSFEARERLEAVRFLRKVALWVLAAAVVIVTLMSVTVVNYGHVAVPVRLGKISREEVYPGIVWKGPITKLEEMSVQTQEYTMSISHGEGRRQGDDSISLRTKDQANLPADIQVFYHLIPEKADSVLQFIGKHYDEVVIRGGIRTGIRDAGVRYTVDEIFSARRDTFVAEVKTRIAGYCFPRGIEIEDVLLRHVGLPPEVDKAVERKLAAQQDAEAMEFVLQKTRRDSLVKIVEAGGIAQAQKILDRTLTEEYLQWYGIEMMRELAQSENTTFVFSALGGTGMPVVTLDSLK